MSLTKTAELELLNVVNGYNNDDKASTVLPSPMYRRRTPTTFINDINTKLGVTDTKIVNIHHSKDIVVVVANYANDSKGVLAYYSPRFDIYEILSTWFENDVINDFYPFKETKLNRQNFLYGLCKKDGKTSFFLMSDLMEAVGVLNSDDFEQESFYSALFDIETEIIKDPDDPTKDLDPKVGNTLFSDYEKIGFNQDAFNNDLYSFVLWKDNGSPTLSNVVQYVKFVAELSQQEAIDSEWQINEPISISQGKIGTGSNFKGLSVIDVLSGEETLSKTETSLGSIIFSTQKDVGQDQIVTQKPIVRNSPFTYQTELPSVSDGTSTEVVPNSVIKGVLDKVNALYNNPDNTILFGDGNFTFKTKYSDTNSSDITIPYNQTLLNRMLAANNITINFSANYAPNVNEVLFDIEFYLVIDGVNEKIKDVQFFAKDPDNKKESVTAYDTIFKGVNNVGFTGSNPTLNTSFDFIMETDIQLTKEQESILANTTSQIIIENDGTKNIYKIVQSKIDSYEGTNPVFEAPRKAFISLKERQTGRYEMFEFNGTSGDQNQSIFWNDITTKDYTPNNPSAATEPYKVTLQEPQSITSVEVASVPLNSNDYSLDIASGELSININIAVSSSVVVEYITSVGIPKRINFSTTTLGNDLYIFGVNDNGELSNTGISIVGAGDNSLSSDNLLNNYEQFKKFLDYVINDVDPNYIIGDTLTELIIPDGKDYAFSETQDEDKQRISKIETIEVNGFIKYVVYSIKNSYTIDNNPATNPTNIIVRISISNPSEPNEDLPYTFRSYISSGKTSGNRNIFGISDEYIAYIVSIASKYGNVPSGSGLGFDPAFNIDIPVDSGFQLSQTVDSQKNDIKNVSLVNLGLFVYEYEVTFYNSQEVWKIYRNKDPNTGIGGPVTINGTSLPWPLFGWDTPQNVYIPINLNEKPATTTFGFNLYRSKANIDYDEIAEEFEVSDFKVKHVQGYRQKDLLYIFAYNEDYTEVAEWTQIYPDSFKPYTYLPYANPDEYFAIERFNQNKQQELRNSVFDREFLDIGVSGNTLLAETQAENTDLNDSNNDSTLIVGHTNEPLFNFEGQILKTRNEIRSLQFTLSSAFIDKLQGEGSISTPQGELLAQLFGNKNADAHNLVALGDARLTFSDGTNATRPAIDFTRVDETEMAIKVGIFLIDINKTKTPESLSFYNKNGDLLMNIDLMDNQCINGRNINFDIVISENADGIRYDYAKLDETGYDKPYEPTTTAKGGK